MFDALFPIFYPLALVVFGLIYWQWINRKPKRKYWFIARREVHDPDNVTITGPFQDAVVSTKYIMEHPNIGVTMQAFQYELPANNVNDAKELIMNGASYVREIQPQYPDRNPSLN